MECVVVMDEKIIIDRYFRKSFNLTNEEIMYLESLDKNTSLALRKIINSYIKRNKYETRNKILDRLMVKTGIGFFFILNSYLFTDVYVKLFSISIGVFLVSFGVIGGIFDIKQLNKIKTLKDVN